MSCVVRGSHPVGYDQMFAKNKNIEHKAIHNQLLSRNAPYMGTSMNVVARFGRTLRFHHLTLNPEAVKWLESNLRTTRPFADPSHLSRS